MNDKIKGQKIIDEVLKNNSLEDTIKNLGDRGSIFHYNNRLIYIICSDESCKSKEFKIKAFSEKELTIKNNSVESEKYLNNKNNLQFNFIICSLCGMIFRKEFVFSN